MSVVQFDPTRETPPSLPATPRARLSRAERAATTEDLLRRLRTCAPDEAAGIRNAIVVANCGVAEALATRYRGRGIPHEDLVQVANEGLVKAVQRFDPSLDVDLLVYAVPLMRGEIRRYFRDLGWTVRPPRPVQELQGRMKQAIARLGAELGREPNEAELREALGVDEAEYREARAAFGSFQPLSLDQPVAPSATLSHGDVLPADDVDQPSCEARIIIDRALRSLPGQERRMIYLRFFEERTQKEIAQMLGMSQMQVSRRLQRVLERLRDVVGDLDWIDTAREAAGVA
jgi:RNA polymerase sigma-B factor